MEQINTEPYIQDYEAFSEVQRDQGSAFRTSILGFDKNDVLSYIDKLVQDVAEQRQSFDKAHYMLAEQNRDLSERVNRYEKQMYSIRQELDDEKQYNQNAREREDLFKKAVGVLQEKVAYLQANQQNQGKDSGAENSAARRDEIVLRLKDEILRKDAIINKMDGEIARKDDNLRSLDKTLEFKDNQLEYYARSLDESSQKIAFQTEKITRMSDQIISLKKQIADLEERLEEASSSRSNQRSRSNSPFSREELYSSRNFEFNDSNKYTDRIQSERSNYRQPRDQYSYNYDDDLWNLSKNDREKTPKERFSNDNYNQYDLDSSRYEAFEYTPRNKPRYSEFYDEKDNIEKRNIRIIEDEEQDYYQIPNSYRQSMPLVKDIYNDPPRY